MLTQERLKELLDYSPETGLFYWRVSRSGINTGRSAGHKTAQGYVRITVEGSRYLAHVLAVLFMTGSFPEEEVDHRDLDTGNNVWNNLRVANRSLNSANCRPRTRNKVGLKGTYKRSGKAKRKKPFVAQITVNQKTRYLGCFATPEEAHQAYLVEAKKAFGEFARAS